MRIIWFFFFRWRRVLFRGLLLRIWVHRPRANPDGMLQKFQRIGVQRPLPMPTVPSGRLSSKPNMNVELVVIRYVAVETLVVHSH